VRRLWRCKSGLLGWGQVMLVEWDECMLDLYVVIL
jgi:hypothetical protein